MLLFSGKDDQVWPSDFFATRIVERLKEHGVREVRIHPVTKRPNVFGGTPEGQARANEDSWQNLLAFLDAYLRK